MTKQTYRVWSYEVWGNARDGFEVNNRFKTNATIDIDELDSNADIIRSLKSIGFLRRGCRFSSFEIDREPDYTLYVTQTNQAVGGLYPICELEAMKDD